MPEWNKYSISNLRDQSYCISFSSVYHVTHIQSSLPILIDRKIKAGLVYDESILNTKRILVAWLSPNTWHTGYRYGNVRFEFDWNVIINNKKLYWVEAIDYKIPACRILITEQTHNHLQEYNPENKDGPWWYDSENNQHYLNGNYCLEFLVEDDLSIRDSKIEFVSHHSEWCSLHRNSPKDCPDLRLPEWHAAGLFFASILAQSIKINLNLFQKKRNSDSALSTVNFAFSSLYFCFINNDNAIYEGDIKDVDDIAIPLARAICNAYVYSDFEELEQLRSLFKSKDSLKNSLAKLIAAHFGIENWENVIEKD